MRTPLGSDGNAVERVAYHIEIVAARFRDEQALAFAIEQFDGQFGLECLDLVAHRPLRHAKLFSRARKTLMPGRGFESLQGIQRRQARTHRQSLNRLIMRKTRAGPRNDALQGVP